MNFKVLSLFILVCVCVCVSYVRATMQNVDSESLKKNTTFVYSMPWNPMNLNTLEAPAIPALTPTSTGTEFTSSRSARRGAFSNSCTTTDNASGTCMSRFNCMRLGGTIKGSCSTLAGICCETNLQCGQTSKLKRTIISNPLQFAGTDCLYVIEPFSSNVCQLLVEFESFHLPQPQPTMVNSEFVCVDYLEIGDYELCGANDQQHLYLPFKAANGIQRIPLNFHLPSGTTQSSWRLIVTQLECPAEKRRPNLSFLPFITDNSLQDARTMFSAVHSDLDLIAPTGCDQYYRQTTGNIRSFNYNEQLGTFYLPNMAYVICIKPVIGSETIEYTVRKFSLSVNNVGAAGFDTDCHPTVYTPGHREDYLVIPRSSVTINNILLQPFFYCGTSIPANTVITALSPFIMYFASDKQASAMETGFSIDYRIK